MAELTQDGTAWLVIGKQPGPPSARAIDALGKALGLDPYSAKQSLLVPAPHVVRKEANAAAAEEFAQSLRQSGVLAFVVSDRLFASLASREVKHLVAGKGGFDVELHDGAKAFLRAKSVVAVVRGNLKSVHVRETDQVDPYLGTVGSIREREKTEFAQVLDIHLAGEAGFFRIAENTFDFLHMYPGRTTKSGPMMAKVVEWVRAAAPSANMSDDFEAVRGILGVSNTLLDTTSFLREQYIAKPFHMRIGVERSRLFFESDAYAFHLYSSLCRLQALLPATSVMEAPPRPNGDDPDTQKDSLAHSSKS